MTLPKLNTTTFYGESYKNIIPLIIVVISSRNETGVISG